MSKVGLGGLEIACQKWGSVFEFILNTTIFFLNTSCMVFYHIVTKLYFLPIIEGACM